MHLHALILAHVSHGEGAHTGDWRHAMVYACSLHGRGALVWCGHGTSMLSLGTSAHVHGARSSMCACVSPTRVSSVLGGTGDASEREASTSSGLRVAVHVRASCYASAVPCSPMQAACHPVSLKKSALSRAGAPSLLPHTQTKFSPLPLQWCYGAIHAPSPPIRPRTHVRGDHLSHEEATESLG